MRELRNISVQLVSDDDTPLDDALQGRSAFLHSAFKLHLDVIVGDAEASLSTESLGHLWEKIQPDNGRFTFELATELPYFLPTLDKRSEYVLRVSNAEIYVSLRMIRAFVGKGFPDDRGMTYLLVHRRGLQQALEKGGYAGIHPVPIKTFVSRRFSAAGTSAENVIQKHFYHWRDAFVSSIAQAVDAIRAITPESGKHLLPYLTASAFPIFWVVAQGRGCAQFVGELGLAAFRALTDLPKDQHAKLEEFLNAESALPVHAHALALARTYCHFGYLGLSIVQVCVACETVLAQKYREFLLKRGVSNKAIKDNRKDITFSQLLSMHLFTMRDVSPLPDAQNIIGRINWARRHRNDVVHEGSLQEKVTPQEVEDSIAAAEALTIFLIAAAKDSTSDH